MNQKKGGRWCSAPNCTQNSNTNPDISFFLFPKQEERARRWVINCRRQDLDRKGADYLSKNCRLCSLHFEKIMFANYQQNRLKPDAVPTLFTVPNPPKQIGSKRKLSVDRNVQPSSKSSKEDSQDGDLQDKTEYLEPSTSSADLTLPTVETGGDNINTVGSDITQDKTVDVDLEASGSHSVSVGTEPNLSAHSPRKEKLRKTIKGLRNRNSYLEGKVCNSITVDTTAKEQFLSDCDKYLNSGLSEIVKMQVNSLSKKSKGIRYSIEFKIMALTLYFLSCKAYCFMQSILNLPTTRTLRSMTQNWQYDPGMNDFIFASLELKMSNMKEIEKYCVLSADEMSLKTFLFYCISKDEIIGLHNTGGNRQMKPASSVLVFMVRSICGNWKQPISFHLTSSGCSAPEFKSILYQLVDKLIAIGLYISIFVSDMGSNFLKFARDEGVTSERPYFMVHDKKVFYMFDVPHLMKSLRNNLLKYDFVYSQKVASWEHITQFFEKDKMQTLRLARKLTEAHLHPNGFQKMKVNLAVQVFSHSVASAIYTHVSLGALEPSAVGTAEFLETCNNFFDMFNSSSRVSDKLHGRAWIGSKEQHELTENFSSLIGNIEVKNKEGKNITATIKCFGGFQITIAAFLQFWASLKDVFSYVLTRRLNQDCLENFFGSIRQQGGNSTNPTPIQFIRAFKKLVCLNYFQHSSSANCAEDFDILLSKMVDRGDVLAHLAKNVEENPVNNISVNCSDYREDLPKQNALHYVCGYLIKKCLCIHKCELCSKYSVEGAKTFDLSTIYSHFKAFRNNNNDLYGNLKTPDLEFVKYVGILEEKFLSNVSSLAIEKNVGIKLLAIMENVPYTHPCENFPKTYLLKLFIRMRLFYFLKYINQDLKCKSKENRNKFIKINHL